MKPTEFYPAEFQAVALVLFLMYTLLCIFLWRKCQSKKFPACKESFGKLLSGKEKVWGKALVKTIEHLLSGKFENTVPSLLLSEDRVDVVTHVGENYRGELGIGTNENYRLRGMISVDEARIVPERDRFAGTAVSILFGADVTGLKNGDSVSGNITLSTNVGEYRIPVFVQVEEEEIASTNGQIRYLEDFARLAEEDYDEAFRLFTNRQFVLLLTGSDAQYLALYRGLTRNPVTYHRMEEFLVGCGLKEPVVISADADEASFFNLRESRQEPLTLHRSTWGNVNIEVTAEGDFLEVPKKRIMAEDFVGSVYDLDYIILKDRLGRGRSFGRIILNSFYSTIVFNVTASPGSAVRVDMVSVAKRNKIKLMRLYLDYRMERTDLKTYAARTVTLLSAIREMGDYPILYTLYEAYVNELSGKRALARNILRTLENHNFSEDPLEAKAGFLYMCHITGLLTPGQIDVVARIREWYQRKQESFILMWLLFQVDEDVSRTPGKRFFYMDTLYDVGNRSPLLYMEALSLFRKDDSLLRHITKFIRHVLTFAVRGKLLTENIALRAAYLSDNEKTFTPAMYKILSGAYEAFPSEAVLEAICKLIMKGQPGKSEYFKWYTLAVEHDLHITRLYEYYVETMPENYQKLLPLPIRKYFTMNNTLSDSKRAFLYANIIRNRKEDPGTFADYSEAMASFSSESLKERKINSDYAVIYQEFAKEIPGMEEGELLARVLFTDRIYTDDPRVREVVVCHEQLKNEEVSPLIHGTAYIRRYTPDARILFSNGQTKRYSSTVAYSVEPLMDRKELSDKCRACGVGDPGLILNICAGGGKMEPVSLRNIDAYQKMVELPDFTSSCKMDVRERLLEYYSENAENDTLDHYLRQIDYVEFAKVNKVLLIEVMISRGMYDIAFDLLTRYGFEHVDVGHLVRLTSRMISKMEGREDEELLLLSAYVFRKGKYDERTLSYLVAYFNGSLSEMVNIRMSAKAFYVETYPIDERILMRAMFIRRPVEEGSEILEHYIHEAGKKKVIKAYLIFSANAAFMGGKQLDGFIAKNIAADVDRGEEMDIVCRLALLKYYSEKDELTIHEENQLDSLLEECAARGLRFRFLQNLPGPYLTQYQLEDKVFVEHMASPSDKVVLHYKLSSDPKLKEDYRTEPMNLMYRNIFSREFILFYGEILTYYITAEHNGSVTKTPEKSVTTPSVDMEGRSRYQLINQMLSARRLGKKDVFIEKLKQYQAAGQTVGLLFTLKEET